MNLEQKSKQTSDQETQTIDQLMEQDLGVFGMMQSALKGGNRFWLLIAYCFTFAATAALLYSGYRFWIASDVQETVFWGVWLLVFLQMQIALKMWGFLEMNRVSIIREIKRLEIQINRTS